LDDIVFPTESLEDQGPPIGIEFPTGPAGMMGAAPTLIEAPAAKQNGNGNGHSPATVALKEEPAPGAAAEAPATRLDASISVSEPKLTDRYGIVVFSHLRWGFVWQRPQQFLSRFARKHPVLFVEEPIFDQAEGSEPRLQLHRVMPEVTVAALHAPHSWNHNPRLPALLREKTQEAIDQVNGDSGAFDRPLLWYYSPMDSTWSLGHFENRGIVYDCMDELSQFTGAPPELVEAESR